MTTEVQQEAIARTVLEELDEGRVVLFVPGTDYRLHLDLTVPAASLRERVGKRVRGIIHAASLRIHPARGGGRFIEPVIGMPRIVAGFVKSVDTSARQVVLDAAVPMVVTMMPEQDLSVFKKGALVNFYVQPGVSFTPVDEA